MVIPWDTAEDLVLRHGGDRAHGRGRYTVCRGVQVLADWPTTLHGLAQRLGVLRGYEEASDA